MPRNVLLLCHGDAHEITEHHIVGPRDLASDRVHTLDVNGACRPTFAVDAACPSAAAALPRLRYQTAVTMHSPYYVWMEEAAGGRRGLWRLRQQFFRNVHRWLARGGRLMLELPIAALCLMSPALRSPMLRCRDHRLWLRRASEAAAYRVCSAAVSCRGSSKLFDVVEVGEGWCLLGKCPCEPRRGKTPGGPRIRKRGVLARSIFLQQQQVGRI